MEDGHVYRISERFRNGWRPAVMRAFTAGQLHLAGKAPSLAAAAKACGSNIHYVRAAIALLEADGNDPSLLNQAVAGRVPLLEAANRVRTKRKIKPVTVAEAVVAWREWTAPQRAEFGRAAGVAEVWDDAIVPTIGEERPHQQAAE
jgi:hypothetical protein